MKNTEAATGGKAASIRAALRGARLFRGLDEDDLAVISNCCRVKPVAKGQYLFRQDQKAFGFFLVLSGSINLHRIDPKGREVVLCVFRPGETLAEGTLSAHTAYPADAKALEQSKVLIVDRAGFLAYMQTRPGMALRILETMGMRMRVLVRQLESRRTPDASERLAAWLLRAASPVAQGQGWRVDLDGPKKMLAAELGITPETLSRSLTRLSGQGAIRMAGRAILIPDRSLLQHACMAKPER